MTQRELARVSRAATLRERCSLARAHPDWFQGEPRLAVWAHAVTDGGLEENPTFAKRLGWFGVDLDDAVLASRELSLPPDFEIPEWAKLVREVEHTSTPPSARGEERVVFEPILAPWISVAERLVGVGWDWIEHDAQEGLRRELLFDLAFFAQACFARDLERERLGRQSGNDIFLGALEGAAATTEIYDTFVARALAERAWFDRYPCLVRLLATRARLWAESCTELLAHLEADRPELEERFGSFGRLLRIEGGLSDSHHGGRRVRILVFERARIVHKPRSVAIERVFSEMLRDYSKGLGFELHAPWFLDRGDHGWVEHVASAPLRRGEESSYFERAGALLALFWALGGTDGHDENLIAHGDQPVLVDVETLLAPPLHSIAYEDRLSSSVVRTGLLPTWSPLVPQAVDQSGLGARRGERRGTRYEWLHRASDHMRIASVALPKMTHGPSEPHFDDGQAVALDEHVPALVRGFSAGYDVLPSLPRVLASFEGLSSRLVVRSTLLYQRIQQESVMPARMADGFLRSVWLDRLVRPALADGGPPGTWLEEERAALECGDVPRFAIGVGELSTASGIAVESTGLQRAEQRLTTLSPSDNAFQCRVIELSFVARELAARDEDETRTPAVVVARAKEDLAPSVTTLMKPARELVRMIMDSAHDVDEGVEWLQMDWTDDARPTPRLTDGSLYSGTAGIGLALAAASTRGSALGEDLAQTCRRAALGAFRSVVAAIEASPEHALTGAPLGFVGVGGLVYGLAASGKLLEEPALMESAKRLVLSLSERRLAEDRDCDLIEGNAGLILALSSVDLEHSVLAARIEAAANAILRAAVAEPNGLGWRVGGADRARCGISHGNSGIALALMEAYRWTRLPQFRDAALRAIALERSLEPEAATRAPGWCNGPAGIAIARARMLLIDDLPEIRDDLARAIALTRTVDVPLGSLCCGMAGVNDTLSWLGDALGDPTLVAESHGAVAARWRAGAPPFHPRLDTARAARALGCMPSLMRGAGGILLGMLRALPGERLPYPLSLL